ncbi:MAG TPA: hypothetical protein VM925_22410 [Labilithrix sp.]|nr:hypothetical protein [Labilithrix sp.]
MPPKDRAALRNLVIAIVASTGALVVVGTTCLGRGRARPDSVTSSATADRASVRSSAGGVPESPAGTTVITAAQLERGASATGSPTPEPTASAGDPSGATFEDPVPHTHAPAPAPMFGAAPAANAIPPATATAVAPPMPVATPAPSPVPTTTPSAVPSAQRQAASYASAVQATRALYPTPTEGLEGGAGQFVTEPPPFSASSLSPNPEAGAGPFITDQVIPPPTR